MFARLSHPRCTSSHLWPWLDVDTWASSTEVSTWRNCGRNQSCDERSLDFDQSPYCIIRSMQTYSWAWTKLYHIYCIYNVSTRQELQRRACAFLQVLWRLHMGVGNFWSVLWIRHLWAKQNLKSISPYLDWRWRNFDTRKMTSGTLTSRFHFLETVSLLPFSAAAMIIWSEYLHISPNISSPSAFHKDNRHLWWDIPTWAAKLHKTFPRRNMPGKSHCL